MAELIKVTETPEAIEAKARAFVWEEYTAPRKKVPRARIVEHHFYISIPKVRQTAAPLAFVIEHFPTMSADYEEYRAGYDQLIRHHDGALYTPKRYDKSSYRPDATPREHIAQIVEDTPSVCERTRDKYAEQIARDDVRADKWHTDGAITAQFIDEHIRHRTDALLIIGGEVWRECLEPAYEYESRWTSRGYSAAGAITATVDYVYSGAPTVYGANDRAAIAYYHPDAERRAFIRVIRPDLVTISRERYDLETEAERTRRKADEITEKMQRLRAELAEAEAKAEKARRALETYEASPSAYWIDKAERMENADASPAHQQRLTSRAHAIRAAVEAENRS